MLSIVSKTTFLHFKYYNNPDKNSGRSKNLSEGDSCAYTKSYQQIYVFENNKKTNNHTIIFDPFFSRRIFQIDIHNPYFPILIYTHMEIRWSFKNQKKKIKNVYPIKYMYKMQYEVRKLTTFNKIFSNNWTLNGYLLVFLPNLCSYYPLKRVSQNSDQFNQKLVLIYIIKLIVWGIKIIPTLLIEECVDLWLFLLQTSPKLNPTTLSFIHPHSLSIANLFSLIFILLFKVKFFATFYIFSIKDLEFFVRSKWL